MAGLKIKSVFKSVKAHLQPYFVVFVVTTVLTVFILTLERFKECGFFCIGPIVYLPFLLTGCIATFVLQGMLQILHIHKQKVSVFGVLLLIPFSYLSLYLFSLWGDSNSRTQYRLERVAESEECLNNFLGNKSLYSFSDIVVEPAGRRDSEQQGYTLILTITAKIGAYINLHPDVVLGHGQASFTTDDLFNPITVVAGVPQRVKFALTKNEGMFLLDSSGTTQRYKNTSTPPYLAVGLNNWTDKSKEPLLYVGYSTQSLLRSQDAANRRIAPIYVLSQFRLDDLKTE